MPVFKKWIIAFFSLLLAALVLLGSIIVLIDPYFHYHAPLEGLSYEFFYQRFQNDGITKHFEYDAIITGNSMAECFHSSECDALFGTNSIKVPYAGASPKELDMNLRKAFEHNDNIRMVIMCMDYGNFIRDKDYMNYEAEDYPVFLYDDNPFNDVKYLYNKHIIKSALDFVARTLAGAPPTSFDEYSQWKNEQAIYGADAVFASYERLPYTGEEHHMSDEQYNILMGNIGQNYIETIEAHPDVQFYLYFPPYSVLFWDKQMRMGSLELQMEAEMAVIEALLPYENVHLFSFLDAFELVQDFSHYKDYIHHSPEINSMILECLASGEHRLTRENYTEYSERIFDFYSNYNYDAYFN